MEGEILQTLQRSLLQAQNLLDQNRILINEINQNQESRVPYNLGRNVGLIRELNNNIRRVVDLYADLSGSLSRSTEAPTNSSSEENASTVALRSYNRVGHKRCRPA
ncbi:hypothetical protein SAY87_023203 [Trapa incisa]|uniref:Protein EARLY FLOWERING 4 domain-containing protein n=1 Tax=Trapa incisa TaxID=236973 RepID=A0AAN7K9W0_9MYRT|nr:hypothetical protein SAY87_023203 [Trapa incisa]